VLAVGTPEYLATVEESHTGVFLAEVLGVGRAGIGRSDVGTLGAARSAVGRLADAVPAAG